MKRRRGVVLAALAIVAVFGAGLFLHFRDGLGGLGIGGSELVVLGYDDDFPDAQRAAYFRPFTSETNVRIRATTYDGDYEQLKARLKDETPDVVQVDGSTLLRGVHEDLFLPIDYRVVGKDDLLPQAAHEFGVGTDVYAIALGWNPKKLPNGSSAPGSWADFWDVKKYLGGRSMKKSPRCTLEIALMADGVAAGDLYKDGKLDVDRALRKLDELKPHVKEWWSDPRQPVSLLSDGKIAMAAARGERLSLAAHQEEPAVELTWTQAVMGVDYWAVPRVARNPEQAMRFIAYANLSHRQATFATLLPLGPVNPRAFGHIEPGVGRRLNTHAQNLSRQVFLDQGWWAEHEGEVTRRFDRWLKE
jgi:putative spermidine/putrescine transport system substrate-binding protein